MTERRFKHISVGKDGRVWAADKTDGTICRLYGDAGFLRWVPNKVGKANIVAAVDWGNAWCVNKDHQIWQVTNADDVDADGTWTQVPTHSGQADAQSISVGTDGSVWYGSTDGALFRHTQPGDGVGLPRWMQDTSWDQKRMGDADVISVHTRGDVWCLNKNGQVWRTLDHKWQQVVERGPDEKVWTYKIKPGDGLMAIVRKKFTLKDPQDTQEINRLVDLIVAQNHGITTRDRINTGDMITLRY